MDVESPGGFAHERKIIRRSQLGGLFFDWGSHKKIKEISFQKRWKW
jgi:hypothetical protein